MPKNYTTPESPRVIETRNRRMLWDLMQAGFTIAGAQSVLDKEAQVQMVVQTRERERPEGLLPRLVDALDELVFLMDQHRDGRTSRENQRRRIQALKNAREVLADVKVHAEAEEMTKKIQREKEIGNV